MLHIKFHGNWPTQVLEKISEGFLPYNYHGRGGRLGHVT